MDRDLCDELLHEILHRLPSDSKPTIPLVSKRWLFIYRSYKTSLSLRLPFTPSSLSSLASLLSNYPLLSSLTIVPESTGLSHLHPLSDHLLLCVAKNCRNLRELKFQTGPVSLSSLKSLSLSCKSLTSLRISSFRPFCFCWLMGFQSLKHLYVLDCKDGSFGSMECRGEHHHFDSDLQLESLCLTGTKIGDVGMDWLWENCRKIKKLQLRSCEGTGADDPSWSSFITCLSNLQELELRTCRTIADKILTRAAQHCKSLTSLVLYDGGSREGLHRFISECGSLRKIDLRLPLDLEDEHLVALSENCRGLVSLRLQSCCLITGDGLKSLSPAMNIGLEELVLINCDVVEREPGLLTSLGQNLRSLCKLDLSYNELLQDRELGSMLCSCANLVEIKLRGCGGLTDATLVSMFKSCKFLETIDISHCCRITPEGVEFAVLHFPRLNRIFIEETKISDTAKNRLLQKRIEVENQNGSY